MTEAVFPFCLTALSPWAWHGLAVPSGTSTLNDVVTDTSMAFATAAALGMAPRSPCLPSAPDYRGHLAALPFKTTLFLGHDNRLNRPLARRLNLDAESGMPKSVDDARKSGNIKDYYHIQEVAAGAVFHGCFLHADPLRIAREAYGSATERLVIRARTRSQRHGGHRALRGGAGHLPQPAHGKAVRSQCRPAGGSIPPAQHPAQSATRTGRGVEDHLRLVIGQGR